MFLDIFYPLSKIFSPFNVFRYLSFRSAYAAVTALLIAFLFAPAIIEKLKKLKFGQEVRDLGPSTHLSKSGTPTMGGVFIILSVVVAVLSWVDLKNTSAWICLGSLLGFGAIGFLDDWLKIKRKNSNGLSVKMKFIGQFLVAGSIVAAIYMNGNQDTTKLYLPFFKNAVVDMGFFWIPVAVVYLVWWSNAVNLTDGLDGLATGLVIMSLLAFALIAYLTGRADFSAYLGIPHIDEAGELTVFSLALLGACVGFLWFNSHPAEIFMGDVGSLSLGGILGTFSLILKKEVLLMIIGGVFVLEGLSVIIQVAFFKLSKGRRVFKMAPLHHHFEMKGWKETKVVVRFWILGGIFAIIALSTLKIQ